MALAYNWNPAEHFIYSTTRGKYLRTAGGGFSELMWSGIPVHFLSEMSQMEESRMLSTSTLTKVSLQPGMALGHKIQRLYQERVNTDGRPTETYSRTHKQSHTRWGLSTHEIIWGTRMLGRGPLGNVIYRYLSDHTAAWFIAWGPMSRKTHKSPPSWAN